MSGIQSDVPLPSLSSDARPRLTWTDKEDCLLKELIRQHGTNKWALVASKIRTKTNKQCRRRWQAFLNAMGNKGVWTPEEDEKLLEGHRLYGNRWTEIARMVPGRTDNAAKNRFAALTAKRGGAVPQNQSKSPSHSDVSENSGDGDEPVQERHRRRESRCHESEDHPLPKRAKLGDVDEDFAEGAAVGTSSLPRAADERRKTASQAHAADDGLQIFSSPGAADEGPRVASPPRNADTDGLAINPRSLDDEPARRGRAEGASVASDSLRVTVNGASGAFRDGAADDASAAGGIDELWRKAELRAVTAEVAESEARMKALGAERDAREARVARASERCRKAEVSIQQATSAVHMARHAQYSLRAAEWAAAVGVREGVAAAEEGRRRLNQLLMLAGSESGHGEDQTKSITLGGDGMLRLEGSDAAASGRRDEKESTFEAPQTKSITLGGIGMLMLAGSDAAASGRRDEKEHAAHGLLQGFESTQRSTVLMLEGSDAASGKRDEKENATHGLLQGKRQEDAIDGAAGRGERGGAELRGEREAEGSGRLEGRPLDALHALKALQMAAKDLSAASFAVADHGVDLGWAL
ncbi:unnamed protein product [Closterium sp. Naga37s-1]|nr:unnamed protein product [Closterium sp. Naga37s-1]